MESIPSIKKLLFELQKLPGVGPRSAKRLAESFLRRGSQDIEKLAEALINVKNKIKKCTRCFNLTEQDGWCSICEDQSRNKELLCIVEESFDILKVENCGAFQGIYHVLHGALSPLNRIHPKNLTLSELEKRLNAENIKEILLAIDSDLEGDTTALYIFKMIEGKNIKISRLARGIPYGGDLEFIDDKTLNQAISNRSYL